MKRVWNEIEFNGRHNGSDITIRISCTLTAALAQTTVKTRTSEDVSFCKLNEGDGIMLFSHEIVSDEITVVAGQVGMNITVPYRLLRYIKRGF